LQIFIDYKKFSFASKKKKLKIGIINDIKMKSFGTLKNVFRNGTQKNIFIYIFYNLDKRRIIF